MWKYLEDGGKLAFQNRYGANTVSLANANRSGDKLQKMGDIGTHLSLKCQRVNLLGLM